MPKFTVAESTHIEASPERVFEVISNFGTWTTWSPWLCSEPNARVTVTENPNSLGSIYGWEGEVVGAGEIEHKKLQRSSYIEEELRFTRPWKSTCKVTFDLTPNNGGTIVTWTMFGGLPWFMFWMKSMMTNVIGMDYERGLRMLKEYIETDQVLSKTDVRGVTSVGPIKMVGVRKQAKLKDIGASMNEAIGETEAKLKASNVEHEGKLIAVYHKINMSKRTLDYTAGVMINDPDAEVDGLASWYLPESKAMTAQHVGCYSNLGNAWSAAHAHLRHQKLKQKAKAGTFEIYRNGPDEVEPADLITDVFLPVK